MQIAVFEGKQTNIVIHVKHIDFNTYLKIILFYGYLVPKANFKNFYTTRTEVTRHPQCFVEIYIVIFMWHYVKWVQQDESC